MPITQWCWRCQRDVPMLDEAEWQTVAPLLGSSGETVQRLRQAQTDIFGHMALAKYRELTGHPETDLNVLLHHRAGLYGRPCTNCGKPLRTPRASICAACGQRHRV
jgi:uncharacterized OB-fold protein